MTQITAALSSGLVSTACFDFSYKLNGFSLELLTITVEIKCDEPSATTCKHDKRGINVASVRPVQARFPFPCFWQHYLNFDTSPSFLRRILGSIGTGILPNYLSQNRPTHHPLISPLQFIPHHRPLIQTFIILNYHLSRRPRQL